MVTTLLGVDDSKTMRRVIEITFAGEDFKTVVAENADDAMSKLNAERPSIVLVDASLEGTNGYELCQRVKSAAPSCAVVLLASKQQPYDRNRGSQVGADDFIDKPFDTQQLIDKVGALVRRVSSGAAAPAASPLAATAHGLGPAPQPPAAPLRAPEAARARTQTLAYGQGNPMMAGAGPVAPMMPAPVGAPTPVRSSPAAPEPAARAVPAVAAVPSPAPVAAAFGNNGADFSQKLASFGLTAEQVTAVLALSREVVEKVVWEVVPTLAEAIIKEEIQRLTRDA